MTPVRWGDDTHALIRYLIDTDPELAQYLPPPRPIIDIHSVLLCEEE